MSMHPVRRLFALVFLGALAVITACDDKGLTDANRSPLAGLARADGTDSLGNAPPPATDLESGYFRGRVLGQADPIPGQDSVETAPRVAGVLVRAYPRMDANDASPELGPATASVTTDVNGDFQFPLLDGGAYVVTFTPPDESIYSGVWVTAVAHSASHEHPWWVVLPM